VKRPKVIMKTR